LPFDKQAQKADVIAMVKVDCIQNNVNGYQQVAILSVERILKGSIPKKIILAKDLGISELRLDDIKQDGEYLVLLKKGARGIFISINGHYSVYPI
jgi:hypothetical protein